MTNAEDEEEEGEGKKKKKEKKEKGINYSAQGGASIAQVGDHDLAKAGKTIRKQLYKEHAEVAAMSADKVGDARTCIGLHGEGHAPGARRGGARHEVHQLSEVACEHGAAGANALRWWSCTAGNGKAAVQHEAPTDAVAPLARALQVVELRRERCTTVEGPGIKADQVGGMFKPLLKFEHTGLAGNMLHATRWVLGQAVCRGSFCAEADVCVS